MVYLSVSTSTEPIQSFDLDDPVQCDDECWDPSDPAILFKQPEGKPSLLTAFVLMIRLNQILATCLRTIVSRTSVMKI